MNWTPEQLKEAEQRIQARCKVVKVRQSASLPAPQARKRQTHQSYLETDLAWQIKAAKLSPPETQYQAIEGRRFKIDFAWPAEKVCVLVQGNVHRIPSKFYADCELLCLLTLSGWKSLPVSRNEILSGKALKWVEALLS